MDWQASYSLGIDEIDDQHKELVELFRRIIVAIDGGGRWSDIHYEIVAMRRHAESHFEIEEMLMRLFGYPGADAHAQSHREFFARIDAIQHASLNDAVEQEMVRLLYDWLTRHINGEDRAYAQYVLAQAGARQLKPAAL